MDLRGGLKCYRIGSHGRFWKCEWWQFVFSCNIQKATLFLNYSTHKRKEDM